MLKLTELNYHCHHEFKTPAAVLEKHRLSSAYIHFLEDRVDLLLVKHLDYEGKETIGKVRYRFCKSRNRGWYIPFRTHRFIKRENPDIVLVHGLVFPLQVIALRLLLGRKTIFIVQHHGEKPFTGIKRLLQKQADKCINAYTFTSMGNAAPWIAQRIIKDPAKCHEIIGGATDLEKKDKQQSKASTGMNGSHDFLWVGRLNANKDPLCVLAAFEKYLAVKPSAKLYMIYQEHDLEEEVKAFISKSPVLATNVILKGKTDHNEIGDWFSAADYYISASHKEGGGYALLEAMACGCIPVVTDIPSFRMITNNGKLGSLYQPGNAEALLQQLLKLDDISTEHFRQQIINYSKKEHSSSAFADKLYALCCSLRK